MMQVPMDTSRAERRQARFQNERGKVPERWTRSGASEVATPGDTGLVSIVLDAGTDIKGARYKAFEAAMAGMGMEVISKKSTRFAETVVVRGDIVKLREMRPEFEDVIDILTPLAVPVPSSSQPYLPAGVDSLDYRAGCTAEQASRQIGILDAVAGGRKADIRNNRGEGAIVIVWDFLWRLTTAEEFYKRPGGLPTLLMTGGEIVSDHGSQVTSACCGLTAGLASGAAVGLLPVVSDIMGPLGVIDALLRQEAWRPYSRRRAVVVNMSFNMTFTSDGIQESGDDIRRLVELWNSAMNTMLRENPRLVFVNAAGNDGEDACVLGFGSTGAACPAIGCYSWPTFGATRQGLAPAPVVRIGSVHASNTKFPAGTALPRYSNHGTCVKSWAHGFMCLYASSFNIFMLTQGTSFAAPVVTSQLALLLTAKESWTAEQALEALRGAGSTAVSSQYGGGRIGRLDPAMVSRTSVHAAAGAGLGGGVGPDPINTVAGEVASRDSALDPPPPTPGEITLMVVGAGAVVAALATGAWVVRQRRQAGQ